MGRFKRWGRLWAVVVGLGACVAATLPAGGGAAGPDEPVPTVFIGDSATANYGIAPIHTGTVEALVCLRARENYPAVATRQLADQGITLDVRSDRSCSGATVNHLWETQKVDLPGVPIPVSVEPQQNALQPDTALVVGSLGGNTLGFSRILTQCSDRLRGRDGGLFPARPVDGKSPAGKCRTFFESGPGAGWLDWKLEMVEWNLAEMFDRIDRASPDAEIVLVGYSRLVPADENRCREPIPGGDELPFADIGTGALDFLDEQVQTRLNTVMAEAVKQARKNGSKAHFVDLYAETGKNTACDGADRGIGGLLEGSQLTFDDTTLPWFAHPNTRGRDIQAAQVTDAIAGLTG